MPHLALVVSLVLVAPAVSPGESPAVKALGSTSPRTLAERYAEVKNILDFGASPAASDNSAAIEAAVAAAARDGGGVVLVPSGSFRYTRGIAMRDHVTITGYGQRSVLFYDPPAGGDVCTNFGAMFVGAYEDYPALRPICDQHPLALIPIAPAAAGASALTARPAGGFAKIAAGDWIIVAEGGPPKWNSKIQYVRIIAREGDTLTLERPLDFAFDGSSGAGTSYGVERIHPVENAWLERLTLKTGPRAVMGAFGCSLAVQGGIREVVLDPFMDPVTRVAPNPYANDVHQFEISDSIFLRGNFGGFNRSSYSRFVHNYLPAINDSDQEYGEGASFDVIAYNHFAGHTGKNPLIGIGRSYFIDISHNVFSNVARNSAVKVVAGWHGTIAFNTFNNVRAYPISIGSAGGRANGLVTKDWLVIGNRILLRPELANSIANPAIAVHAYPDVEDVVVSQNWVDHPIKVGSGARADDRRTIQILGNSGPGISEEARGGSERPSSGAR